MGCDTPAFEYVDAAKYDRLLDEALGLFESAPRVYIARPRLDARLGLNVFP